MTRFINQLWQSIVKPPYRNLPWLLWGYVVACACVQHSGGVFNGHLFGFDDQTRMVQVLDWINNPQGLLGGWYDRTIMRANPPEGFTSIWSRIVDIPIAAVILAAQHVVPQRVAVMIAAAVVPLTELAILFLAAPYFARPLVGKNRARLILLFLMFATPLLPKYFSASGFLVGEASHHPWYTILDLTLFGAVARLAMGSASRAPVLMLGGSVALLTAVGIEAYPMMAAAAAIAAGVAWGFGRPVVAARAATGFLCAAAGSLLLLPLHQPPQSLFAVSFAEPSILGVILVACAGLGLKITQMVIKRWGGNKILSAVILCAAAAVIAGALVWAFPQMLDGPAAALSPAERDMAARTHYEARPVHALGRGAVELTSFLAPPLIGLAAALFAIITAPGRRRRAVCLCYLGFAAIGAFMSEQFSRYYHHAMTTACAWLLWLWERCKRILPHDRGYNLAALGLFVALGPFWMLLLPSIALNAAIRTHVLLYPASLMAEPDVCDTTAIAGYLDRHYSPQTLLDVPYWQSSEFLFQSGLRIDFLANYPSHNKFIDNYTFFGTTDMEAARQIALRHGIDLAIACRVPDMHVAVLPPNKQILIARMQTGDVPAWMKRVAVDVTTPYLLYAIDKNAVAAP